MTLKRCRDCGEKKPMNSDHFYPTEKKGRRAAWRAYCIPCWKVRSDEAEARRRVRRQEGYHDVPPMARGEYGRMLAHQGGVCAICGEPPAERQRFDRDHNHRTNEIRGLLHSACNRGLGHFVDSPERLRAAADYLENPPYRSMYGGTSSGIL